MAENSKIEWTQHTFNPWRGCTKVAAGCQHCYADQLSKRNPKALGIWGPDGKRVVAAENYWQQPLKWDRLAKEAGERHRVFCASLADVFEDWPGPMRMPDGLIAHHAGAWGNPGGYIGAEMLIGKSRVTMNDVRRRLFALIDATHNLDWLLLTKRPQNILRMWPGDYRSNVWLGTSVSEQKDADANIPQLLLCDHLAEFLFVSAEPLLGPVKLKFYGACPEHGDVEATGLRSDTRRPFDWFCDDHDPEINYPLPAIGWVICGGESGPGARPMHPDWARSLRDQCQSAGVPFLFKQWGEWRAEERPGAEVELSTLPPTECVAWGNGVDTHTHYARVGKQAAGRLLDGREWNEFPTAHLVPSVQ